MPQQVTQRVRVTRPFYHKQEIQGVDSVIDLDRTLAHELRNANKVVFVANDEKKSRNEELVDPNKKAAEAQAAYNAAHAVPPAPTKPTKAAAPDAAAK